MLKSRSLTFGSTDDIIGCNGGDDVTSGNDVTFGFLFFLWWFLLDFFVLDEVELVVVVVVVVVVVDAVVVVEVVIGMVDLFFDFFDFGDFVLWHFLWCPSLFIQCFRFGWFAFGFSSDFKSWLFSSIISSFKSSSRNRKVKSGYPIFRPKVSENILIFC